MRRRLRITWNAPLTLGFVLVCVAVQLLDTLTAGRSNDLLFSAYRSSFLDPLASLRVFLHVLGHGSWTHLLNNMMYILILMPMMEEKYGAENILFVTLATALSTGLINIIFFPGVALLGASGVVFALILLSSITGYEGGGIPLTFILVVAAYLGQQIHAALSGPDNVSQMAHIVGGIVGAVLGFYMNAHHMTMTRRRA